MHIKKNASVSGHLTPWVLGRWYILCHHQLIQQTVGKLSSFWSHLLLNFPCYLQSRVSCCDNLVLISDWPVSLYLRDVIIGIITPFYHFVSCSQCLYLLEGSFQNVVWVLNDEKVVSSTCLNAKLCVLYNSQLY